MTDIQTTIEPSEIGRRVRSFLEIMNSQELAAALDVKPETLEAWRSRGVGPHFAKLGQAVFYRAEDLIDWIAANVLVPARKAPPVVQPGHTTDIVVPEPDDGA